MANQQNTPPNVLFYSKNCKTSSLFMSLCQQNKILKYFQLVDVDNKIKELSEKGLKIVPTIIVKGLNKPIEGKNVFAWLETVISMNTNKKIETNNNQYQPEPNIQNIIIPQNLTIHPTSGTGSVNPNNNVVKRNIVAPPIIPSKQEQNNAMQNKTTQNNTIQNNTTQNNTKQNAPSVKSQPYGFLKEEMTGFSDSFAYLMSDNPLPKSFLPCDKDLEIYTAPEGDKLDKKNQELLIKNIEIIRENDKNNFVKNMEHEHNKIIRNNDK